jgi:hypothetical protein
MDLSTVPIVCNIRDHQPHPCVFGIGGKLKVQTPATFFQMQYHAVVHVLRIERGKGACQQKENNYFPNFHDRLLLIHNS